MCSFFNVRAEGYDQHMAENIEGFTEFYHSIETAFPATDKSIEILDLGAGTGLELEHIFTKAPNAKITAVDVSRLMLNKLVDKYTEFSSQIKIIEGSYIYLDFNKRYYDFAISIMSFHHLLPKKKVKLYEKIKNSLCPSGKYIEGDYIVSEIEETNFLAEFNEWNKNHQYEDGKYHIDIPFSEKTQFEALRKAGFNKINVIFRASRSNVVIAA